MSVPSGNIFYLWKLKSCLPVVHILDALERAQADAVCIKVANGRYTYNQIDEVGDWTGEDDFLLEVIAILKAAGYQVGGWDFIFTKEVVSMVWQIDVAVERFHTLGLDFFLIDAEEVGTVQAYWKSSPYRSQSAIEFMNGLQSGQVAPVALSSYRFPDYHRELPWAAFLDHPASTFVAPQMYWVGASNPAYQLHMCLEQYAQRTELPMVPMGAAFKEGGWTVQPSQIAEFTKAVEDHELPAWGFWVLDQAMYQPDWLQAMRTDYDGGDIEPPPPPEKPERVRIVGLESDETLRMRDGIWGLVNAKTWNGAEFDVMDIGLDGLDRDWYQVGPSIWVAGWYTEVVA